MPDFNGDEYGLGLVSIKKKWMFDSYSRLFLDRLLPREVKRVIYLDGDVLVLGSLKQLWELDLRGKCCGACMDCISEPYYDLFGIKKSSRYCNSGLILMDLEVWRKKRIEDQIKKYVRNQNGYVFFMEQTVFNVVLQDEIRYLPAAYNVSSLEQVLSYKHLVRLRRPLHFYGREEVHRALEAPVVVHMTGFFYVINRAWNEVTNHPEQKRFAEYSKGLGWDGDILQKDQRGIKKRMEDRIIHMIPVSVLVAGVSVLYNFFRVKNIERIRKKVMV